jgi:hypothetical protein
MQPTLTLLGLSVIKCHKGKYLSVIKENTSCSYFVVVETKHTKTACVILRGHLGRRWTVTILSSTLRFSKILDLLRCQPRRELQSPFPHCVAHGLLSVVILVVACSMPPWRLLLTTTAVNSRTGKGFLSGIVGFSIEELRWHWILVDVVQDSLH